MSSDGLFYSRRRFISRGVQLLSVAATVPIFLDHAAQCMAADFEANPLGAGRPDRILVVLQLAGGNDGLNTIIPIRNDHYYKARPKLAIAKDAALKLNDDFGVHPNAAGLKKLFDDGNLAILHAVGYPNPNRSHFRATDIWATAEPSKVGQTGWLGRYFDSCCSGADPGAPGSAKKEIKPASPTAAVALTNEPPQALEGAKYIPVAFRNPNSLSFRDGARNPTVKGAFEKLNDPDPAAEAMAPKKPGTPVKATPEETSEFVQRTALNARLYAEQIRKSASSVQNKATYPVSRLGNDLKLVAQMIAAGLPTRVYYVSLGGFDTHSQQANRHEQLIGQLSSALSAFIEDLKALGHLDRTTVMTFSEFGRRVAENGSVGTDHGEAAPLLVAGGAVQGGFHGLFPDLTPSKLHRGDVPYTLDFRRLYATILREWLKADDVKVLGQKFEALKLFRAGAVR